jgi:transcriptional regulator with XRE-family HTH domain
MTTALKFRNIDASPDDPIETWPFEGILTAVERGTLPDWRRLAAAIRADPWGPVAQQVVEAIRLSRPYGTAELLEGVVARARKLAADSEREEVASEVRALVARSRLSKQDFAERIGTSRSRLSTYMSGKVVPSATLIVRMRRIAQLPLGSVLPLPQGRSVRLGGQILITSVDHNRIGKSCRPERRVKWPLSVAAATLGP